MAKRNEATSDEFVPEYEKSNEGGFVPGMGDGIGIQTDFDLDGEWKASPLVPNGTYHGAVTNVTFNVEKQAIQWEVVLNDNGGLMSDGETPLDGSKHFYRNWMPLPGDENIPDSSGRGTKRQAKINMLMQFSKNMKVNMNSGKIVAEAIANKEWIGLSVDVKIKIREYEGRFSNEIDRMVQVTT